MPQHRTTGRTDRNQTAAGQLVRGAALAGSLALLPLTAACETEKDSEGAAERTSRAAVAVVAPAKVEVIASLTDCKAKIRMEAEELREGVCHTAAGDYLITTFPEEKFKVVWLDSVAMYGGTYLVGSRWVISAPPKLLTKLRPKVGGTIQQLRGTGPHRVAVTGRSPPGLT